MCKVRVSSIWVGRVYHPIFLFVLLDSMEVEGNNNANRVRVAGQLYTECR